MVWWLAKEQLCKRAISLQKLPFPSKYKTLNYTLTRYQKWLNDDTQVCGELVTAAIIRSGMRRSYYHKNEEIRGKLFYKQTEFP